MLLNRRLTLVGLLAALLVALFLVVLSGRDHPHQPRAGSTAPDAAALASAGTALGPPAPVGEDRTLLAPSLNATPTVAPDWPAPDLERDLHGVVEREDSTPVAGAEVEIWSVPGRSFGGLDLEMSRRKLPRALVRTDRLGRFVVPVEFGELYDVQARSPGLAVPLAQGCSAGEFLYLVATPAGVLRGRVTRADMGTPVADVSVRWFRLGRIGTGASTVTDGDGVYAFDSMPTGEVEVEVIPAELQPPPWTEARIFAGKATTLDFALAEGSTLVGRVLDDVSGAPIAGAEISPSWVFKRVIRSAADGSFRLTGLEVNPNWGFELHVRAEGFGGWNHHWAEVGAELPEVEVRLKPERRLRGRVVDGNSRAPLAGVRVLAVSSVYGEFQKTDWLATTSDPEGRYEVRRLRPDLRHAVLLIHPGYGSRVYELPPEEKDLPVVDLPDLALLPEAAIAGDLVDTNGAPVPGIDVTVTGWNADRGRFNAKRIRGLASYSDYRRTHSDDRGRFSLSQLAGGHYRVSMRVPDQREPLELAEIDLADGERLTNLRLVVDFGLGIGGQVVNPDGAPCVELMVSLERVGLNRGWQRWTDTEGRFRFGGMESGEYRLILGRQRWNRESDPEYAVTVVPGIQAGEEDLRLMVAQAAAIRGTLFTAEGSPAPNRWLWLELTTGVTLFEQTEADGSFSFRVPASGQFDIQGRAAEERSPQGGFAAEALVLASQVPSGTTGLNLFLPSP